jgi:hypothetical protein
LRSSQRCATLAHTTAQLWKEQAMDTRSALATPPEAADYLQLKEQSLRRLRMEKRGPKFIKVGGRIRYRWEDIDAWLAANEHDPEHGTPAPRRPTAPTRQSRPASAPDGPARHHTVDPSRHDPTSRQGSRSSRQVGGASGST